MTVLSVIPSSPCKERRVRVVIWPSRASIALSVILTHHDWDLNNYLTRLSDVKCFSFSALSMNSASVTCEFPQMSKNVSSLLILLRNSHFRYGKAYRLSSLRLVSPTVISLSTSSVSPTHLVKSYLVKQYSLPNGPTLLT
jgi:hypothetical protein